MWELKLLKVKFNSPNEGKKIGERYDEALFMMKISWNPPNGGVV